jgi:putative transposase
MAQRTKPDDSNNPMHEAYACLLASGRDVAGEALRILVNEASRIERAQHLQTTPYERSAQRVDYANGHKSKTVLTSLGEVTFEVPQVRSGGFYPSALERGSRSEQAMNLALAEMYVQGVSTRKVITVLQKLVGPEISISSTKISRCTALLDEGLQACRTRPLDETPYVILMPVMNGCATPTRWWTARCWWPSASPPQGTAGYWACRWRCQRPRCTGGPSWTA